MGRITRPQAAAFALAWLAILLIILGIEGQVAPGLAVIFAPGALQTS